jgi:hypothetical protein
LGRTEVARRRSGSRVRCTVTGQKLQIELGLDERGSPGAREEARRVCRVTVNQMKAAQVEGGAEDTPATARACGRKQWSPSSERTGKEG